jgi:hypothetical protein
MISTVVLAPHVGQIFIIGLSPGLNLSAVQLLDTNQEGPRQMFSAQGPSPRVCIRSNSVPLALVY